MNNLAQQIIKEQGGRKQALDYLNERILQLNKVVGCEEQIAEYKAVIKHIKGAQQ